MTGHWRVPSEYIQYNVSWFVETDPHSIQIFKTFTVSVVVFQEGERKKTSTPRRDRRSLSEEDEQRTNTHVQSNLQQTATGNYDRSIESHTDQPTNQLTNNKRP